MKLYFLPILCSLCLINGRNITDSRVKAKRTLTGEIQSYGDPSTIWFYNPDDSFKAQIVSQTVPRGVDSFYSHNSKPIAYAKVFEPKVAAQQVLYEFQQTPTNAVSNVHVKQLFQPEIKPVYQQEIGTEFKPHSNINPNIITSETVVSPVQHSHVVPNHPPPSYNQQSYPAALRTHPLYNIPHYNTVPKKYIYVNGKFIYEPSVLNNQQYQGSPSFIHPSQQFPQHVHQLYQGAHPYLPKSLPQINYFNNHVPRPNLVPPQVQSTHPPANNKFEPPQKHQMQPINEPSQPPPKPDKLKESKEEKPVREEAVDDEREEKPSSYDEEDYEKFGRYAFDDDEDDDHQGYRYQDSDDVDDEENDNKRGSSTRYITAKRKYPKKTAKGGNKNEFYFGSKYEHPHLKQPKKSNKNMHYKSFKNESPKHDVIEGRSSENVPVTHKHKMFKEKWFVSKSTDDRENFETDD